MLGCSQRNVGLHLHQTHAIGCAYTHLFGLFLMLPLGATALWHFDYASVPAGTDAPAGACGLAGAAAGADAACAEDSGLSLDDAWANHRANAKACADDRQRFRALIDFLNLRQQP